MNKVGSRDWVFLKHVARGHLDSIPHLGQPVIYGETVEKPF